MQDYTCIYVAILALTNTTITPSSHITKQRKIAPELFIRRVYSYKKQNTTHIFCILSASFCSCKICINNTFRNIAEVSISRRGRNTTRT